MTNTKTILLSGATGFLGEELAKRFMLVGYNINLLIRPGKYKQFKELEMPQLLAMRQKSNFKTFKTRIFVGDITKKNLDLHEDDYRELADSVDEVFHCAAATKFSGVGDEELLITNFTGTQNILEFCVSGKKKCLHHISTAYVSGRKKGIIYENDLNDSYGFNNQYEYTKFLAEQEIEKFSLKHNLTRIIYRPSIIVGDSTTGVSKNFDNLYSFAKTLWQLKQRVSKANNSDVNKNKKTIISARLPINPNASVNLVPVDFTANAIMSISLDKQSRNKTFHIVNPQTTTLSFILESVSETLDISGLKIVESEEFTAEDMTRIEKLIWRNIKVYDLYMRNEPYFQQNNAHTILNDNCVKCPRITTEVISKLINYALDVNWGDKVDETQDNYAPKFANKEKKLKKIYAHS